MLIYLIDPYYTDSHKSWAEGLQKYSQHQIEIYSLPASKWKWRMEGGAIELAEQVNANSRQPDLFLVTDMLNLSLFKSLLNKDLRSIPTALYFHENQLTYPYSEDDQAKQLNRDLHFAFINYTSALCAEHVFFNSKYHQDVFLGALSKFIGRLPDFKGDPIEQLIKKCSVLYLGVDLIERFGPINFKSRAPDILWNHRWEYDKNPEMFIKLIDDLSEKELNFRLNILGRRFRNSPVDIGAFTKKYQKLILNSGFQEEGDYLDTVKESAILPITSKQDYFGISLIEAMYCGVVPLAPNRLVFPEHLEQFPELIYSSFEELSEKAEQLLNEQRPLLRKNVHHYATKFDWKNLIHSYDHQLDCMK
jgi:glycosyltransferase involved in cell wall biosynthesis